MRWGRLSLGHGSFRPRVYPQVFHISTYKHHDPSRSLWHLSGSRFVTCEASDGNKHLRESSVTRSPPTENDSISISGLVRTIRKQKKVAFAHISDGSSLEPVQAVLDPVQAKDITNGSYVELTGRWKASPGKGQAYELHVTTVDEIGKADPDDYPIQKKSQTVDYLRSLPHLRIRAPLYSLMARTRSQLISGIHDFYSTTRPAGPAVQVHPPLITSSDCEGAGDVFTILPRSVKPVGLEQDQQGQPYFRSSKYLTVSAQLHLEAYAAELGDVWTLSPTFRAEESDTPRHLSEFYMLEAEFRNVKTLDSLMAEVQQLLQHLVRSIASSGAGKDLLAYYSDPKYIAVNDESQPKLQDRWQCVLHPAWPEISYTDAMALLKSHHAAYPDAFVHSINFDTGLQLEHERFLVTEFAKGLPLFVTHYPKHIKPFYMLPSSIAGGADAKHDQTVACFDLLFPFGAAEVVGGSLREHRLPSLINAMRQKGLIKLHHTAPSGLQGTRHANTVHSANSVTPGYPYLAPGETLGALEWYADLRRYGTSPHGGFGMGFDRILAYVSGITSVRDSVGFPRYFGRADC